MDKQSVWATFDYQLHAAGRFNQVASQWVHLALIVSAQQLRTFSNGVPVPDTEYGFPLSVLQSGYQNSAFPHPEQLLDGIAGFKLLSDITIGSRQYLGSSSSAVETKFDGNIAGLFISRYTLSRVQVQCLYNEGLGGLSQPPTDYFPDPSPEPETDPLAAVDACGVENGDSTSCMVRLYSALCSPWL